MLLRNRVRSKKFGEFLGLSLNILAGNVQLLHHVRKRQRLLALRVNVLKNADGLTVFNITVSRFTGSRTVSLLLACLAVLHTLHWLLSALSVKSVVQANTRAVALVANSAPRQWETRLLHLLLGLLRLLLCLRAALHRPLGNKSVKSKSSNCRIGFETVLFSKFSNKH